MFGTDGIRATLGESPFTQHELHKMGIALGRWIIETYGANATVLLGHDTRLSCSWVKATLKSGLLMHPLCIIDAGVLPTPAVVQLTLKHSDIACGLIISASHNPYQDNGIKLISSYGKLTAADEQKITAFYDTVESMQSYNNLGEEHSWHHADEAYIMYLEQFFAPNFLSGKKIVLDCANGATYAIAPRLFEQFGATVVTICHEPTGYNINEQCGAVHVEQLKKRVLQEEADAGFAFDGDGDRVIAVNRAGTIKDGDAILCLLLDHPRYTSTPAVVGTIMTNKGLQNWLEQKKYRLIRTPVGDKYIARRLAQDNLMIGGEQSGHIILYDYLPTGDGIFTALRIMETIMQVGNETMQTFKRLPQLLINVPIKLKKDLTQEPFASIIKHKQETVTGGRIVVRFSGTEAKLRIMVEHDDARQAELVGHQLAQKLQQLLEG